MNRVNQNYFTDTKCSSYELQTFVHSKMYLPLFSLIIYKTICEEYR